MQNCVSIVFLTEVEYEECLLSIGDTKCVSTMSIESRVKESINETLRKKQGYC